MLPDTSVTVDIFGALPLANPASWVREESYGFYSTLKLKLAKVCVRERLIFTEVFRVSKGDILTAA